MFTGLVQGIGRIARIENRGRETRLGVSPCFDMAPYAAGESIAVNGVCLTVEEYGRDWFAAFVSAETLSMTNLGRLRPGSEVNLERALALGDRLGGHLVSGHVDCLARVDQSRLSGSSVFIRLTFPPEFGRQVIPKGSVALDGISLTVNACGKEYLEVNIIPATQSETIVSRWSTGSLVNMETDIIGKYVERMLAPWIAGRDDPGEGKLTLDFLRRNGFG